MVLLGHSSIVVVGLITDLAQAPHFLMRWFAIAVSLQIWLFLFGEWLILAIIGVLMFQNNKVYTLEHKMTKAFYKILIATLVSGGISLALMPSIRYWYWDYYYEMIARENKETLEDQ
jgi:hypothetical protein